jgi:hypothetical protein
LRKLRASWVFYSTVEKSVEKNVDAGIDSLKQRSTNTFNHLVDGVEKNVDAGIDSLKQRSTNTFNHLVDGVEKNVDAGIDSLKQRSTNTFNHFVDGVDDFSEFFETTNQTSSVVDSSVKADVNKNMALNIDSIDTIDTSSGSIATLAQKSARRSNTTHNPKPDVVVIVVWVVPVAIGRTTVFRIVVPRTTAQQPELPAPFFTPSSNREKQISVGATPKYRHALNEQTNSELIGILSLG